MSAHRFPALAIAYFIAEIALDACGVWIILSHGHPWWALVWCIFAGLSANANVKRHSGLAGSGEASHG